MRNSGSREGADIGATKGLAVRSAVTELDRTGRDKGFKNSKQKLQHGIGGKPRARGAVEQQSGQAVAAGFAMQQHEGGKRRQDSHPDKQDFLHPSLPAGSG